MEKLIILVIIAVAFIALRLYNTRNSNGKIFRPYSVPTTVDRTIPDLPISFGHKCMWFAVKTDNLRKVAEILKLKGISACNWQVGIDRAYRGSVFIPPTIDGWTLALGWGLPHGDEKESIEEVKSILQILSMEFGEAQFFSTHRVVEFHCWINAAKGNIERVYSYSGESGQNIAIEGSPTEFEQTLNLGNSFSEEAKNEKYFEREDIVWPNEHILMRVAAHWSIDPSKLEGRKDISPGLGLLGEL